MYEREKAIIITNNDRVFEAYKDEMQVILKQTYEEVLIATRDMVYDCHILLTHPQASSLKPNQTPYRSVIVYPGSGEDAMKAILLIEKCLEVYRRWQEKTLVAVRQTATDSLNRASLPLHSTYYLAPGRPPDAPAVSGGQ